MCCYLDLKQILTNIYYLSEQTILNHRDNEKIRLESIIVCYVSELSLPGDYPIAQDYIQNYIYYHIFNCNIQQFISNFHHILYHKKLKVIKILLYHN